MAQWIVMTSSAKMPNSVRSIERYCTSCNKQRDDTVWSDQFSARLCMDCYNAICEEVEAEEMAVFDAEDE
jgi:hypothetical protein